MNTKEKLLMKVASLDKSATLMAKICVTGQLMKVARREAIKDYATKRILNKKASLEDSISEWWKNDANKAGLATGLLGGLGTYGLTGLIPGLKNNQAARIALSAGGAFGGYKGGQWGANKLLGTGYGKDTEDVFNVAKKDIQGLHTQADTTQKINDSTVKTWQNKLDAANKELVELKERDARTPNPADEARIADLQAKVDELTAQNNNLSYQTAQGKRESAAALATKQENAQTAAQTAARELIDAAKRGDVAAIEQLGKYYQQKSNPGSVELTPAEGSIYTALNDMDNTFWLFERAPNAGAASSRAGAGFFNGLFRR